MKTLRANPTFLLCFQLATLLRQFHLRRSRDDHAIAIFPGLPNGWVRAVLFVLMAGTGFGAWSAKFEPADGETYTGIGQNDEAAIMLAVNAGSDSQKPAIIAVYAGLSRDSFAASRLLQIHNFYPGAKINLGVQLPVGNDTEMQKVYDGTYDKGIRAMAKVFKGLKQDIFLRMAYEIDGPWNAYDSAHVVSAWRYIVDMLASEGVTNVAFVWNVTTCSQNPYGDIFDWYPGDAYVDFHEKACRG